MKTVAITGSGRGFGFAMLDLFYKNGYNVVMIDVNEETLKEGEKKLLEDPHEGKVLAIKADVTDIGSIEHAIEESVKELGGIDIWINNAGVNQNMVPIWEVEEKTISRLLDIDLKGTILCSKAIMNLYLKQGHGQIYNVEGYGSDDATMTGLSIYGTSKRGVTYFTEALTHEVKETGKDIQVGKITPGIMITSFINHSLGYGEKFELPEKTKMVYNYLGDYPETIAAFMVEKIMKNKKNGAKFTWLTKGRAMWRFMSGRGKKVNFFEEKE